MTKDQVITNLHELLEHIVDSYEWFGGSEGEEKKFNTTVSEAIKLLEKPNQEMKNDLVAAWNEIDEAIIDLEELDLSDMINSLPTILERLHNARHWLGKYVSEQDVIEPI